MAGRCLRTCLIQFLHINSCTCVSVSAPVHHTLHNSCTERRLSTTSTCDITSSEALRALRPFYLAVHPDLFPQHPRERSTNENSLKKLNSYLDALVMSGCGQGESTVTPIAPAGRRPKPIQLTFFIKARQSGYLKSVSVSLDAYSIGSAVHDILQSCDLFADISNPMISKLLQTKHRESEKHRVLSTYNHYKSHQHHHNQYQEPLQDYPDFDYIFSERTRKGTSSGHNMHHKHPECLRNWLKHNLSIARSRLDSSWHLREENESLKERICSRHRLQLIKVNPDWTAATVKGHLLSFEKTLQLGVVANGNSMDALAEGGNDDDGGLKIVLGHSGSFVSVHGEVHLSCEDTVQQWLQYLLRDAMKELTIVREIDSLEEQLLDMMNQENLGGDSFDHDIRPILKRPSMISPSKYCSQLKDYLTLCSSQQHPSHSPQTATNNSSSRVTLDHNNTKSDDIVITIATKSRSGLREPVLSEDGMVEVPVNCHLSALRDFCSKNHHKISETRREHERSMDEMLQIVQTCKQKLFLRDLRIKANIRNDEIKSSCQRLLQLAQDEQGAAGTNGDKLDLKGHHLILTNSYSVSSDGELRIPWDFKITSS